MYMYTIAHRGFSDLYKDNSLTAFEAAVDAEFDMIEMDIQLTLDKEIIIYHDTYLKNTLIKDMTVKEIKEIDSEILYLSEFFEKIDVSRICVYLDIKGSDDICEYLHASLRNLDKTIRDNIIIGSFDFLVLDKLHTFDPSYSLGIITDNVMHEEVLTYYINKLNIVFVCFHWTTLRNNMLTFLHEHNIMVFVYTCQNAIIENFMLQYDVDGIVSNYRP